MKNLKFICVDSRLEITPQYETENAASQIVVDFTGAGVDTWTKWVNIETGDGTGVPISLGTGVICSTPILAAWLKKGRTKLQAYAIGPSSEKIVFELKYFPVQAFMDLVGDDTSYDPSALTLLQNLYSALAIRLDEDEADIVDILAAISVLQGVDSDLEGDLFALSSELNNVQGDLQGQITDNLLRLETAEDDIDALEVLAITLEDEIPSTPLPRVADLLGATSEADILGALATINATLEEISIPRYDDIVFEFTPTRVNPTTSKPDYDATNIGLLFPRNDTSEAIFITVQMPHKWKVGSTIYPHVHVVQALNLQATFRMEYKWYNIGDQIPVSWSTYDMPTYTVPYTSGSISQIIKGDGISGVGKDISSILKIKLFRTDNVYTGDILADQFDIHIEVDGFGSETQFSKE